MGTLFLTKEARIYNGTKTASSINGAGKTGQLMGFPYSSVGKESACNAGDLDLIPGSGRSLGEGIGYPVQYSWSSLVTQMVMNLPAMLETWVHPWVGKIP